MVPLLDHYKHPWLESAAGMLYSVVSRFSMVNAELIRESALCGAEPQMAADTYSSESP